MPVPVISNLSTNSGIYSLAWSAITGLPAGCTIKEYKIQTFPSGAIRTVSGSQTSMTGTAQRSGYFVLWAVNSDLGSSVGVTSDRLDTFTILPITERTQTSAKLSWRHLSSWSMPSKYTIKTKSGTQNWRIENPENPLTGSNIDLTLLNAGTTYQIQIFDATSGHTAFGSFSTLGVSIPITLSAPAPPRSARSIPSSRALSITWYPPANSTNRKPTSSYQIQYREVGDLDWMGTQVTSDSKFVLSNLEPSTRYQILLRSIATDGTLSASSITLYGTTTANLNKPSNLQVAETGDTHADLRWNYIKNASFTQVQSYRVEVSKDNGFTWSSILNNLAPTTRIVTIDDLEPETKYVFKVVVVSNAGDEGESEVELVTRQNLDSITSVRVSVNGSSAATLKWASLSAETLENIKSLRVQISTNGNTWKTVKSNLDATSTEFKASKLKPKTKYWMRVASLGKDGYVEISKIYKFTTK